MKLNKTGVLVAICALAIFFGVSKSAKAVSAAPGGELRACVGKTAGVSCNVGIDENNSYNGVCTAEGGTLSCKRSGTNINTGTTGSNPTSTCNPTCQAGLICSAGACVQPSHVVAPNAPVAGPGSAGQATDYIIPGTTTEKSQLVQCGRPGQRMCTLCDLIAGLNNVIRYIEKIAIGVGLLSFTIAGVLYILSAGDSKKTGEAKDIMKNATIGFVIIFAAWVIVNTAITSIGTYSNLGMNITSWGQFECGAKAR